MPTQRHTIDMTETLRVNRADTHMPESSTPDKDNQRIGLFPVVPYDARNVLPTDYGYKSFFAVKSVQDNTGLGPTLGVQEMFVYQTSQFVNVLVALTRTGIWMRRQGTAWQQITTLSDPGANTDLLWTYAVVKDVLFMYRQGSPTFWIVEEYANASGTDQSLFTGLKRATIGIPDERMAPAGYIDSKILGVEAITPTTINMEGQIGIFRAGGSLGFWDSADAVAWSAFVDLSNFTPDLTTLANVTSLKDVIGRITVIKGFADGFIVYATKSIVRVLESPQAIQRFASNPLYTNLGVNYPREVTVAQPDTTHFAWTTSGLVQIQSTQEPRFIVPDIGDMLKQARVPVYLRYLNNRYLCLEILDPDLLSGNVEFSDITIDPDDIEFAGTGTEEPTIIPGTYIGGNEVCFGTQPFNDNDTGGGGSYPYIIMPDYQGFLHKDMTILDPVKTNLYSMGASLAASQVYGDILYRPRHSNDEADWEGTVVSKPTHIQSSTSQAEVTQLALDDFKAQQDAIYADELSDIMTAAEYTADLQSMDQYKGMTNQVGLTNPSADFTNGTIFPLGHPIYNNPEISAFRQAYEDGGTPVDFIRLVSRTTDASATIEDVILKAEGATVYSDVRDLAKRIKAPLLQTDVQVLVERLELNLGIQAAPITVNLGGVSTANLTLSASDPGGVGLATYTTSHDAVTGIGFPTTIPVGTRRLSDLNIPGPGAQNDWFGDKLREAVAAQGTALIAQAEANGATNPTLVGKIECLVYNLSDSESRTGVRALYDPSSPGDPVRPMEAISTSESQSAPSLYNTGDVEHLGADCYQLTITSSTPEAYDPHTASNIDDLRGLIGTQFWRYSDEAEDPLQYPILWVQMSNYRTDYLGQTQADSGVDAQAAFANRRGGQYSLGPDTPDLVNNNSQQYVCGVVDEITIPDATVTPLVVDPWTVELPPLTWLLQNGKRGPVDPIFYGALVYDTQLQKWGNMTQTYRQLLDYEPITGEDGSSAVVDIRDFIIDGGCLLQTNEAAVFGSDPDNSYIRYGKYRHYPIGITAIEEVNVNFNYEATGIVSVQASIDGRVLEYGLTGSVVFEDALRAELGCDMVGKWHTITIAGHFDITHIEVVSQNYGRR